MARLIEMNPEDSDVYSNNVKIMYTTPPGSKGYEQCDFYKHVIPPG